MLLHYKVKLRNAPVQLVEGKYKIPPAYTNLDDFEEILHQALLADSRLILDWWVSQYVSTTHMQIAVELQIDTRQGQGKLTKCITVPQDYTQEQIAKHIEEESLYDLVEIIGRVE